MRAFECNNLKNYVKYHVKIKIEGALQKEKQEVGLEQAQNYSSKIINYI